LIDAEQPLQLAGAEGLAGLRDRDERLAELQVVGGATAF